MIFLNVKKYIVQDCYANAENKVKMQNEIQHIQINLVFY
jgi:hypothetical protein